MKGVGVKTETTKEGDTLRYTYDNENYSLETTRQKQSILLGTQNRADVRVDVYKLHRPR